MNIKYALKKFFGIKDRSRVLTHLNPDSEESKKLKEAFKKIKSLEAQISDEKASKVKKEDDKKDFLDELRLIKEIKQKSEKIENKKFEGHFEINKIFDLMKRYTKLKIELTDKDDKKTFDLFKSFVILPNGNLGIKGMSEEIWAYGSTLNHLIHKPESIKNHIKRKRIPLPFDSEHRFIPDLEKIAIPEIKYIPEDDEFRESEELVRPIKDMIMERELQINKQRVDISYLESLNANLTRNLRNIERSFSLLKSQMSIENSELTQSINGMLEMSKRLGSVTRLNNQLMQQKMTTDEIKDMQEEVIKKLIDEAENEKSKVALRRAGDEWIRMFQSAEKYGRKTIINQSEEVREIPMKPNQPMK